MSLSPQAAAEEAARDTVPSASPHHGVSLGEATRVWTRVALLSFGGPAGQIAVMHRIIVEEKRWISEERFLHALSYCTLLPGPEAQQLATYIGWLMHRTPGGLIAGGLFVLPGIIAIMALSYIYVLLGNVPLVEGLFLGLKAAVLAIVLGAVIRVGSKALKSPGLIALAIIAFLCLFVLDIPFPLVVIGAGVVGFIGARAGIQAFAAGGGGHGPSGGKGNAAVDDSLIGTTLPEHARPDTARTLRVAGFWLALWLVPVALLVLTLGSGNVFSRIAIFFSQMAVVTFGGAYAVLAYVAQAAVENYHWLRPGEMLDGLAMAETTPGPLIMVLQFVGFMGAYRDPGVLNPLLAGTLGGLLTTFVTFAPCFLWIFAGAPYVETVRGNKALSGALAAITAAVVGVIANLALWFALHTLFREVRRVPLSPIGSLDVPVLASVNWTVAALTVLAMVLTFGLKLGMVRTLAICAAAGIAARRARGACPACGRRAPAVFLLLMFEARRRPRNGHGSCPGMGAGRAPSAGDH